MYGMKAMVLLTLNYYRHKKRDCLYCTGGGFPVLADIIRYYKKMFYSLYAPVRGAENSRKAWKGKKKEIGRVQRANKRP